MREVKLLDGENTNGLGLILKDIIERNLKDDKKYRKIKGLNTMVVIKISDVAVTLLFKKGNISLRNGELKGAPVYMEASFDVFSDICAGRLSAFKAKLRKQLITKGSLLTLLKLQHIFLNPKELGQ